MALAVTIGVVSLVAILAVATLSLGGRLAQTSTLGLRDARLDAGAAFGLWSASAEWRPRQLGRLAVGATAAFDAKPEGVPVSVGVTVTRISHDLFWVVAEATEGGALRRENLLLRSVIPDTVSLLADSIDVDFLGFLSVDSIAAIAEIELPSGSMVEPRDGVIHVVGDATLAGGTGNGILIVEGRLVIAGPLSYEGVIVARGGISVVVPGVTVTGIVRSPGVPLIEGNIDLNTSAAMAQSVLLQALTPRPVAGRRWAELP
jgi:hypothetical protein